MKEKTWAVYILFILAIIAGLLAFVDAARYMGWLPVATLGLSLIHISEPTRLQV